MKRFFCFLFLLVIFPFVSLADVDLSPVGRWTIDSDYSTMHENYMFAKTDFYIFEDGTVYRVSITKKKKENKLTICYDDGLWIGDRQDLMIRCGVDVFTAYIDDDGFLYVIKNDTSNRFLRVDNVEGI